jgi:4-hydroxy-L-threonine phosphate dehydrogenase PdxA
VDHGTALDLAGTTKASPKSLLKAIATAAHFCAHTAVHA